MQGKTFWAAAGRALAVVAVTLIVTLVLLPVAAGQSKYKVIHRFTGGDGQEPMSRLILDAANNLYGMTWHGGTYGYGTVFELMPNPDGSWAETVLYSFTGGSDGAEPVWSSLASDSAGNLYGMTTYGGRGYGVVFELTPNLDGTWSENVLHAFTGRDGAYPGAFPVLDQTGSVYATTTGGGKHGFGTVFKLTPNPDGTWTHTVLRHFAGGWDGDTPNTGLVFDSAGSLFGTTRNGGRSACTTEGVGCGTVFQLTPGAQDKWTYRVIHRFTGGGGGFDPSIAGLVFDTAGALYGTTEYGGIGECFYAGNPGCGTVFTLMLGSDNTWSYRVVFRFKGGMLGGDPFRVSFDSDGNLIGTTVEGGHPGCDGECGTVFRLAPNGQWWKKTTLHRFADGKGGGNPNSGLVVDSSRNLYGTTRYGGSGNAGVVFEITP